MGLACCKTKNAEIKNAAEPDMIFRKYNSKFDKTFSKLEHDYNILEMFQFFEYITTLTQFFCRNNSQAPASSDKAFYDEITKYQFQTFIENKILRNFLVYSITGEDETTRNIFKDHMCELYSALLLKVKKLPEKRKVLTRLHVICIGLLYCKSTNEAKVNFLFNLFVGENSQFSPSPELEEFLFSLFMIPSYCVLSSRKKIGGLYSQIGEIDDDERFGILDAFENNDILRLRAIFMEKFFKGKGSLTRIEFEENFTKEDFGWIFSPSGIRENLEVHNDVRN